MYEVSQIAVEKGIKTRLEFLALAKSQKDEGKTDLAEFIANRGLKNLDEAISIGWEMENAPSTLERTRQSRLETLTKLLSINCIDGCQGQWLTMAKEVLRGNEINENEFSQVVQTLLVNGRGKYRNIMILGAANCGKTFLLNPLNAIYNCFTNPATTSFAWVGKVQSIAQPGKTYSFFFSADQDITSPFCYIYILLQCSKNLDAFYSKNGTSEF